MTTTQAILESGIARSTANDSGKMSTDGELIPHINRTYQSIVARMALAGGDNWTAKTTGTFASSPASFTLPTNPIDLIRLETSGGGRTYLIPIRDKDRSWVLAPAVYRLGDSIVSRGLSGDPVAADVWNVYYKDVPTALTALGTALDSRFPSRFELALIIDVALYMSLKDENRDPARLAALQRDLDIENAMIEAVISGSGSATSSPHPIQRPTVAKAG